MEMLQEFTANLTQISESQELESIKMTFNTRAVSGNHATKIRIIKNAATFFKTQDFQRLRTILHTQIIANKDCLEFRDSFKQKHDTLFVLWGFGIPEKDLYDKNGLVRLKKFDTDNLLKPVKDIVTQALQIDDSHIFSESCFKYPSDKYEICFEFIKTKRPKGRFVLYA